MFYDVLKIGMHHYKETEGGRATVRKAIELYGEQREMQKAKAIPHRSHQLKKVV